MIEGTCHCGAVHIELEQAPEQLTDCNCSICRRLGVLWAYYPKDRVRLTYARDVLQSYRRDNATLEFLRCATCGCTICWMNLDRDPAGRMGINARLLDPSVWQKAKIRKLDGADTWTYLD